MPVDGMHEDYTRLAPIWRKCRDCYEGAVAVKAAGEHYLPRPSGLSDAEYDAYKSRAMFLSAFTRTVHGLSGAICGEVPTITAPDTMAGFVDDCTMDGVSLDAFSRDLLGEVLITGRAGVFVDLASSITPRAEPHLVLYKAEQIRNWKVSVVDGSLVTTLVVLAERYETPGRDIFAPVILDQFRVLQLNDAGAYVVQVWRQPSAGKAFEMAEEYWPLRAGVGLPFVPFQFVNVSSLTPVPEFPPLLALADVNISHFQSSADLEHARHWTALPTLFLAGFPEDSVVRFGSSSAVVSRDPSARAEIIAGRADNCSALENALAQKDAAMAAMGSRMLEPQKRAAETAEALRMRQSGENAVVSNIARTVGDAVGQAASWSAWWSGLEGDAADVSVVLGKGLEDPGLNPDAAKVVLAMWQAGLISKRTAYTLMEAGHWTRPGVEYDQEEAEIQADGG